MPKKSKEAIYNLVVDWYQKNYLIDLDDWPELKKQIEDRERYE
jgi:hypothetical protein